MKRHAYRWTTLLSLALVAWLWLAAVHVHADTSAHGSHPVCELCAGLDRAAPPPAAELSVPPARVASMAPAPFVGQWVAATPRTRYSPRAPPQA